MCSLSDMEIPPRTIQLISGQLDPPCDGVSVMLVEPLSALPEHLHVAHSLSAVSDNQVTIQIMNINPSPVKIYEGMRLGTVTPEHNIFLVSDDDINTEVQSPTFDHLHFPNLSASEQSELIKLLVEFCDIFSTEVHCMLEHNVIRPNTSPWSSPVVMVRKHDGTWRFCVDYRKLNLVTHCDAYPLPRIDATSDSLAGCKYFTTLDLASGYWQVALEEADMEKTAFSTPQGHFEFNVMPFGLTNTPATFQRLMECALSGLTNEQCLIYLDDIIIFSSSFKEHLHCLRNVFVALQGAHLQLKLSKCNFACSLVHYLGHVVSVEGVQPDPRKVEAVSQHPVPTTIKELKQFLGLTNYYRKFIYNYAHITDPLNKLLQVTRKISFGALPASKHLITSDPD